MSVHSTIERDPLNAKKILEGIFQLLCEGNWEEEIFDFDKLKFYAAWDCLVGRLHRETIYRDVDGEHYLERDHRKVKHDCPKDIVKSLGEILYHGGEFWFDGEPAPHRGGRYSPTPLCERE